MNNQRPGFDLSIGMMLPSGNLVAEHQMQQMLAPRVALHSTRLPLTGSSVQQLDAMIDNLEDAARLLADARVDQIAFNCTAVSTFNPAAEPAISKRIVDATNTTALTTAQALVAALHHFAAQRMVLVTPYIEAVTKREKVFFEHHGFDVVHDASYGIDSNWDMAQQSPSTWFDFTLANRRDDVDAYVLSCTAIDSAVVIDDLEQALGKPVLTSNQALAWFCQRRGGINQAVHGFGELLASTNAVQADAIQPAANVG